MQLPQSSGVELDAAILQVAVTLGGALYALFLSRRYRKDYFRWLAVACFLYVARLGAIISFLLTRNESWLYWHQVATGWTAIALLWTALVFSRRVRFHKVYAITLSFPVVWSYVAIYVLDNFLLAVLPAVVFLSGVTAWTGWIFLDYWRRVRSPGAGFLGTALLLWAVHHLDYPFLRAQGAWSPWGYYLDVVLFLSTICGITIVVLDDLRGGMRALTSLAAGTTASGGATAALLEHAMALPAARGAALYRVDASGLSFNRGIGTGGRWADQPLESTSARVLEDAMASRRPLVHADWVAPDRVVHAYTAILPLSCRIVAPQVLVVAGDTRDPFAALDDAFLVSLGTQLASALDAAGLVSRLQERTAALARLSTRVVRHDESERLRLSRELHDETAQVFAALKLQLGMLQERGDPDATEGFDRALALLDEGMNSIRGVTETLRPAVLDELGLMPAIRSLITEFSNRSRIAVSAALPAEDWRLDSDVELALYRSLQESLANVARHARASVLRVALSRSGGVVSLTVEDDGVGLSEPALPGLLERSGRRGLSGMQDRVVALGGTLEVGAASDRGVRVHLDLPDQGRE
jgi:signal transduction histidine kinase